MNVILKTNFCQKNIQLENNQKIIYIFRALNTDLTLYKIGKIINSHNSLMANDL